MFDWIPEHGGNLAQAVATSDRPREAWLDLSTGINSRPYPFELPARQLFECLPYLSDDVISAAADYYCSVSSSNPSSNPSPLLVAGSDSVMAELPVCLPDRPLLVPAVGYQTYAHQWQLAGREVITYPSLQRSEAVASIEASLQQNRALHLLIINPNNPTGLQFSPSQILGWSQQLAPGSYLLVDEAFMDQTPEYSLLNANLPEQQLPSNVMVLRSFGKFFGLAGLRLGAVFAADRLTSHLQQRLGSWRINGPAQAVALQAWRDREWQQQAREQIDADAALTASLLAPLRQQLVAAGAETGAAIQRGLFSGWMLRPDDAHWVYRQFFDEGVLIRPVFVSAQQVLLRFGIIDGRCRQQQAQLRQAVAAACTALSERPQRQVVATCP